jgi:hypothetical protein
MCGAGVARPGQDPRTLSGDALVWVSFAAAIPGKRLLVTVLMENRKMMLCPVGSVGLSVGVAGLLVGALMWR